MTDISASAVKQLREKTGAGMLDCKKALEATAGNLEEAVDWLRKKGLSAAAKKSGRVAAEGLVAVATNGNVGAVIEVNSETDFVARNAQFQQFVQDAVQSCLGVDHLDELLQATYPGKAHKVSDELTQVIATIGENMNVRRSSTLRVADGVVCGYVHNAAAPGMGKIGVLVALESKADTSVLAELGKNIAMHIAAAAPLALSVDVLGADVVQRERQVLLEQAKNSGKPAEVLEKMVDGRMNSFYQENVLNEQLFIIDGKTPIKTLVQETGQKAGAAILLKAYVRFVLGDGIEKQEKNLADEVAQQLAQAS